MKKRGNRVTAKPNSLRGSIDVYPRSWERIWLNSSQRSSRKKETRKSPPRDEL